MVEQEQDFLEEVNLSFFKPLPRRAETIDPVKYEISVHRFYEILEAGRYAMQRVSGSPIVTDVGESVVTLLDREGNAAFTASGILLHIAGCESAIKVISAWYKDEPGIFPGDQFFFNDPYVTGNHACDMVVAKPLFHHDQIMAWVASLTHTPETGAIEVGGQPVNAREVFHEGLRLQGVKVVNRGVLDRSILKTLERGVRDPRVINLDTRAKIASNNTIEKYLLQMADDYGADFIDSALRRLIYESEDRARARLRAIPDGIWRVRSYGDHDGTQETLITMRLEAKKIGDQLYLDFTGTSPQSKGPMQCCLPGTIGNIFAALAATMFWDSHWNRGIGHPVRLNIPKGSILRPVWPAPCNFCPPTVGIWTEAVLYDAIGKMYRSAGQEFENDITASLNASCNGTNFGGLDQYGLPYGTNIPEPMAGGSGGTPRRDGCDTGLLGYCPEAVFSDAETIESKYPVLYLMRAESPGSGGAGAHRGGNGLESVIMLHKTSFAVMGWFGLGKYVSNTVGMFGGYPSKGLNNITVYNPGLKERYFEHARTVETIDMVRGLEGYTEYLCVPVQTIKEGDLIIQVVGAGGGYGDPLKRDPELVHRDLMDRKIRTEEAGKVYGVEIDKATLTVDKNATEELREKMREERRKRWVYRR